MKRYSSASIANAFLNRAFAEKKTISPMKIQKLLYIAHGYSLVERDEPLLDEVSEAWKFGPVLNSLYHQCKYFRRHGVNRYLLEIDQDSMERRPSPIPEDEYVGDIVDFVWETYGNELPMNLSAWTHEKGGPWDTVTDGGSNILLHMEVPNALIRDYFKERMYDK
ncbi:MAG: DUF4065 domain-containing protein [Gammaproteobacteria bacterium]|nr:DUF4065 domain-containing protein [Gammaproteobacteria bacterium]